MNTSAQHLSNQTSEWNDRHPLLTKDEFMHWWSHWSRKWLWALDAELWSWNMCRCWCRSVGWCEDHTYSSYANLVGIHSFRHSSSAKQPSLNSNSWWTIGGTSPHPLSAFRHLPKSFSWSPKFLCSSTHLPTLSTSPPQKNRWKFCHQPSPMRSFSCPGLRDLSAKLLDMHLRKGTGAINGHHQPLYLSPSSPHGWSGLFFFKVKFESERLWPWNQPGRMVAISNSNGLCIGYLWNYEHIIDADDIRILLAFACTWCNMNMGHVIGIDF